MDPGTQRPERNEREPEPSALTTMHVRQAIGGDRSSVEWVVARLTPLLLAQAEYRLGPALRLEIEPADLVDEAWLIALPRLAELTSRDDRTTPVLLKFLSTTMTFRIHHVLRQRLLRGGTGPVDAGGSDVAAAGSGVITRVSRDETADLVRRRIDALEPNDREVLVLRGIEQLPSRVVAVTLQISPAAVDQRYSRALKRLRAALPKSVFDELEEPPSD